MARPKSPEALAKGITRAVHEATKHKPPPYWISVETIMRTLGLADWDAVDLAVQHAERQNWLRADSATKAHSLCITQSGIVMLGKS